MVFPSLEYKAPVLEALFVGHFLDFSSFLMSSAPTTACPLCCGHTSRRKDWCSSLLQTRPWSVHAVTAAPFLLSTWYNRSLRSQPAPSLAGWALLWLLELGFAASRGELVFCSAGAAAGAVFCRFLQCFLQIKKAWWLLLWVLNNSGVVPDAAWPSR